MSLYKERDALNALANDSSKSFDKTILTVAGAGFTVSVAFLKDVAQKPPLDPSMLTVSWAFFSLSIMATLGSFLASTQACFAQVEIARKRICEATVVENPWTNVVKGLNYLSFLSLIFAFVFWASFAAANLRHENVVNQSTTEAKGNQDGRGQEQAATAAATANPRPGAQADRRDGVHPAEPTTAAAGGKEAGSAERLKQQK